MNDCEFSTHTTRTAAKVHTCGVCFTDIMPGKAYHDIKWTFDGRWYQRRICLPCGELQDRAAEEEPHVSEMFEFVTGYHSTEEIESDELLSGFLERYGRGQ